MAYKLFIDSFDTNVSAGRWIFYTGINNTLTIPSANNGRHGSASARITGTSGFFSGYRSQYVTPSTHVVIGAAVRRNNPGASAFLGLLSTAMGGADVRVSSNGFLEYYLGSGAVVTTTFPVAHGAWYHVQIGVVIGASGSLEIRVNGSTVVSVSGVNTRPGGSASTCNAAQLYMGAGGSSDSADFDDLYFAYGDELKWLGDIRVDALALSSNSTPQDWTPDTGNAWERLNATAGYITGTTLDDESLFALADYTPQTTAIHGVQVCAYARKTDSGSRSMAIEAKSGSTVAVGSTIALGDNTTEYRQVWLTDPNTAAAWTDGGLDALQIGVKVMD